MQIKPASLFFHLSYSSENVIVSQHLNQDFSIKVAQEPQTNRHNLTSPTVWYGGVCCSDASYSFLCFRKRKTTKKVSIASADTQQALLMKKRQQIRLLICFFLMMQQSDCAQVQSLTQQKLLLQE